MPHALVENYIGERDQLLNTVAVLKNAAADRGTDPSADDLELMQKSYARIDRLDEMIAVLGEDKTMSEETRQKLLSPAAVDQPSNVMYRSAGEMLWDCLHANYGTSHDHDDQDATRRWGHVMKRAAEHMGTAVAKTTATAGDLGGLYVAPVVGPVIDLSPKAQPFLSAIGRRPAPNAMIFQRPRIVDPNFATGAALQSAEKAELASKKFDVKVDSVSLDTVGGYLNISQQLMSLQPGAFDIILTQLQRRVANQGETAAIAAITATAQTTDLNAVDRTDSAKVLTALYAAASIVYANTKALPTWIAYGPSVWAMFGSLVDSAKRPLYPFLGASNAMGNGDLGSFNQGPLGLQQIVTPAITTFDIFMGNDLSLEAYVYPFPVLEAVEPALLGRQVAVAEALAFYQPTTTEPSTKGGVAVIRDV